MKPFWKILIVVLSTVIEAVKDIFDNDDPKALQSWDVVVTKEVSFVLPIGSDVASMVAFLESTGNG